MKNTNPANRNEVLESLLVRSLELINVIPNTDTIYGSSYDLASMIEKIIDVEKRKMIKRNILANM